MSLEKILMPQLGESVTEGTISQWLVKEGDQIKKYDPIAEVMTDKVNAEVPSSYTGIIKEIAAQEGETISVGELMCYIDVEGTAKDEMLTANEQEKKDVETNKAEALNSDNDSMKKRYSPAVLRLAQENNIQLEAVEGTGKNGRITRKDIERRIKQTNHPQLTEGNRETADREELLDTGNKSPQMTEQELPQHTMAAGKEVPVTGVRKVIAENMVKSKTEIPHAWMMVEVDVTNLVKYRNSIKENFKQTEGYNLTFFAFFIKAAAQAIKEFPQLNSSWAGDKIIQHSDVNIAIAVAKKQELFVPVIKNADEKSIKGIAKDIAKLADKARNGTLTLEDMKGGTFTINNTGSFGSVQSMGVINYPQAAILQVESIVKRPVIIDGMFAARDMVNLCLSLDHRVLDGLICGQFMARMKELLEKITSDNTSIY